MSFERRLAERAAEVETFLAEVLPSAPDLPLIAAIRYACEGGKRLRAFLVLEGAEMMDVDRSSARHAAAAVETMHAYSLVHDDLPAMDDDDLRRGRPTLHRAFDEATAILAGDALQALAFSLVARPAASPDAGVRAALAASLAEAAGAAGMVLGQAEDIAAETAGREMTLEEITALQGRKTGALIGWAATAPALIAGRDPAPLASYAQALGLAFQIADDLLDATGDEDVAGKRVGKDAARGKATFVSLLGVDGARARAEALVAEAESALAPYGERATYLREAARFAIRRRS